MSEVHAPQWVHAPPMGNPGSATGTVMYLFAKLKPFEQKEHFPLKEQNGLGWNEAYVRKGPTCQGD